MTGLDRDTSKSPDRTGVCCTGRCAPSQCETITGPSFSSLNKPDQERTPAYRDSSGSESPSGCLLCYFFRRLGGAIWGIPVQPIHIFDAATAIAGCCRCISSMRLSGHPVTRRRGVLRHVIGRIYRRHWPGVKIAVRGLTAITARPRSWTCWRIRATATFPGFPATPWLSEIGQPWCEDAALRRVQSGKDKVRRFFQTGYQAKSLVTRAQGRCPRRGHRKGDGCPLRRHGTCRAAPNCSTDEGLLRPWPDGKHDQGAQALHQIRPHLVSPMGSQPVPAVPAHRRLLAAASVAPDRAPPLAVAHRDVRDATTGIPQDRSCASRSSTPASRSPCPRPTHIATP